MLLLFELLGLGGDDGLGFRLWLWFVLHNIYLVFCALLDNLCLLAYLLVFGACLDGLSNQLGLLLFFLPFRVLI